MGTRLSCFGWENKDGTSLVSRVRTTAALLGEKIAKNIAKTARRQLQGRHLLFGEYLRSWT